MPRGVVLMDAGYRAASMRELQPDPGLHDPVVSARRLKSPGNSAHGYAARCRDDGTGRLNPAAPAVTREAEEDWR